MKGKRETKDILKKKCHKLLIFVCLSPKTIDIKFLWVEAYLVSIYFVNKVLKKYKQCVSHWK